MMDRVPQRLLLYGHASAAHPLDWSWVQQQLTEAGTYWVNPRGAGHPHPRPVWGVWQEPALCLSIGSPTVRRELEQDRRVTVHLDSGTDVVIVEGTIADVDTDDAMLRYNTKYDWDYSIEEYGPLTMVTASTVLAWRSAGWAGRDGFQQSGRWRFTS